MSIFDAGFIVWGYLAFYIAITVAYLVWAAARNRRDERRAAQRPDREDG